MGRKSKNPILFDTLLSINCSQVMKSASRDTQNWKINSWYYNDDEVASIAFKTNFNGSKLKLYLKYYHKCKLVNPSIEITTIPSNLGIGQIPYFICPEHRKSARILFLYNGLFLSRHAIGGALYREQTYSKTFRRITTVLKPRYGLSSLYEEINSPYFKKYYRNNPTKNYLRIINKIAEIEFRDSSSVMMELEK
jgi:hypothetical protein